MPMRVHGFFLAGLLTVGILACEEGTTSPLDSSPQVRVVNANTSPIDVFVDGVASLSSVSPGSVDNITATAGRHTISLREPGSSTGASIEINSVVSRVHTIAAVRAGGILSAAALDDTNAVVPAGHTKVRVLHLAPSAGEITVMRTQPDWGTPVSWQFPFLYSAQITPEGNPYYQSTVGTWDVRAWRKPSEDALGWSATAARVTLDLAGGEKRTVLVLDKAGGGITLRVIE